MAAIRGVTRSFTKALTTAPNAAPMTTATARSTTLPRSRNARNPFNESPPPLSRNRQHYLAELLRFVQPLQSRIDVVQRVDAVDHGPHAAVDRLQDGLELARVAHRRPEQRGLLEEQARHADLAPPA